MKDSGYGDIGGFHGADLEQNNNDAGFDINDLGLNEDLGELHNDPAFDLAGDANVADAGANDAGGNYFGGIDFAGGDFGGGYDIGGHDAAVVADNGAGGCVGGGCAGNNGGGIWISSQKYLRKTISW